jgi:tRNA-dihydrouridine synthase 1
MENKKGMNHPWEWWRSLGAPKYVCSPMVDQSELAFRLLLRRLFDKSHSVITTQEAPALLCYTPMIHASKFVDDHTYRGQRFVTCPEEQRGKGGLFAQFCGHDSATLLAAAKLVENDVDAVDLNLGEMIKTRACRNF